MARLLAWVVAASATLGLAAPSPRALAQDVDDHTSLQATMTRRPLTLRAEDIRQ